MGRKMDMEMTMVVKIVKIEQENWGMGIACGVYSEVLYSVICPLVRYLNIVAAVTN